MSGQDKPIERFDRLLKAMVQGEPPKSAKGKEGRAESLKSPPRGDSAKHN